MMTKEITNRTEQARHTPGPWRSVRISTGQRSGKEEGMCFRIEAPEASSEARWDVALTYYKPAFEEAEANARLLAAAPELLAACKAALSKLDMVVDLMGGRTQALRCDTLATRDLLARAIAKAEARD